MPDTRFQGRRARQVENDRLRITVLAEGGHISEILHKASGVNPLWTPPWPSIEPSTWSRTTHPEYGDDSESQLLSGIMGHNLCLDLFGPPSPEEAAAGLTVHGEASVNGYTFEERGGELVQTTVLPNAGLGFSRSLRLDGAVVHIVERVSNLTACDRPVAWTEHVTLGPPFLEKGQTQFRVPATRSRTLEGREFEWPLLPRSSGIDEDLRVLTNEAASGGYTTHLMDPRREDAWFLAWSPSSELLFGYRWRRADFPWLGIWEENYSRATPPWNGKTLTRGLEFGVSPIPEPRRTMIDRGSLFGVPAYRWIPAKTTVTVEYAAFAIEAKEIPDELPHAVR